MSANLSKLLEAELDLQHLDVEIVPEPDAGDFEAWFGSKRDDDAKYLREFAQDGTGSLVALWNPAGLEAGAPRVIYLGSEGEVAVAGASLDDFLRLLGAGLHAYDLFVSGSKTPFAKLIRDEGERAEAQAAQEHFNQWLKSECGLQPPVDVDALLASARAALPELEAWVEARAGQ
jgi:hypothetical protein